MKGRNREKRKTNENFRKAAALKEFLSLFTIR
jgi:hypothetical protein